MLLFKTPEYDIKYLAFGFFVANISLVLGCLVRFLDRILSCKHWVTTACGFYLKHTLRVKDHYEKYDLEYGN